MSVKINIDFCMRQRCRCMKYWGNRFPERGGKRFVECSNPCWGKNGECGGYGVEEGQDVPSWCLYTAEIAVLQE